VKREVHRCDCLQFLVHFYSQLLLIGSFNFNFSSQYMFCNLLGLISCSTCIILLFGATIPAILSFLFWCD